MKESLKKYHKAAFFVILVILFLSSAVASEMQRIYILKEIDDDTIIIATETGDKLLLKKWSLRFSPLQIKGQAFISHGKTHKWRDNRSHLGIYSTSKNI